MKIVEIVIDSGITYTKAVLKKSNGEWVKFVMPTSARSAEHGLILTPDTYRVTLEGKTYIIGEHKDRKDESQSADKATELHRITALTAVFNLLSIAELEGVETVKIALNMPVNLYKETVERTKMEKLYNSNEVTIEVNGEKKVFEVEIRCFPEGLGLAWKRPELMGKEKFHIVMLGSIHFSVLTFDSKGRPITDECIIEEYGALYLIDNVRTALYTVNHENYDRDTYERIILKTKRNMKQVNYEIAEDKAIQYLKKVRDISHSRGIRFDINDTVIAGGGAILLNEYIKKTFNMDLTIIDNDPLFGDAVGAMTTWGK